MTDLPELHPGARALSAFRVLPDGRGRTYTLAEAESGRRGIERIIRMAHAFGFVKSPGHEPSYAILDIWADPDTGDILQDYSIPHARAFRWWYRTLGLRVDYTDGEATP